MSILDVLKSPAQIKEEALASTHLLKDQDMSNPQIVANALLKAGGRLNREELMGACGLDGRVFQNALFAAKKVGLVKREGADLVSEKAPPAGKSKSAPPPHKKPRKARAKPTRKTKAAPKARALTVVPPRAPQTLPDDACRAVRTADGGAIVIDAGFVVAELAAPQFAALSRLLIN